MRRMLLVANPAASGFSARLHRTVVAELRRRFDLEPVWPDGPAEAETTAAAAAARGVEVIAAMGGDGIVHRVANGLAGTSAILAVIPAGTSNVFARLTGHPRTGIAAAKALAAADAVRSLPTVSISATTTAGGFTRRAVFAAGAGFDADLIRESDERPLRKVGAGTLHYARSAVRVALADYRRRSPNLSLDVDGDRMRAATAIVQIHDAFTFLGRRPLAIAPRGPAAVALRRATPWRLVRVATAAARHRDPAAVAGVRVWHPVHRVEITADGTVGFEADGEYLGEVATATITVLPGSLNLLDPRTNRR